MLKQIGQLSVYAVPVGQISRHGLTRVRVDRQSCSPVENVTILSD